MCGPVREKAKVPLSIPLNAEEKDGWGEPYVFKFCKVIRSEVIVLGEQREMAVESKPGLFFFLLNINATYFCGVHRTDVRPDTVVI